MIRKFLFYPFKVYHLLALSIHPLSPNSIYNAFHFTELKLCALGKYYLLSVSANFTNVYT